MLNAMRQRRESDEKGFTLIELMVVVLIIAILVAIAIPTFLGARKKAQDRAAQSDIRNALTAEKSHYVDTQQYTTSSTTMEAIEPSLDYVTALTDLAVSGNKVYLAVSSSTSGTADIVTIGAKSASGTCFFAKDDLTSGTTFGTSDCSAVPTTWSAKW
jgi:type IV pilus assembly protein PilA